MICLLKLWDLLEPVYKDLRPYAKEDRWLNRRCAPGLIILYYDVNELLLRHRPQRPLDGLRKWYPVLNTASIRIIGLGFFYGFIRITLLAFRIFPGNTAESKHRSRVFRKSRDKTIRNAFMRSGQRVEHTTKHHRTHLEPRRIPLLTNTQGAQRHELHDSLLDKMVGSKKTIYQAHISQNTRLLVFQTINISKTHGETFSMNRRFSIGIKMNSTCRKNVTNGNMAQKSVSEQCLPRLNMASLAIKKTTQGKEVYPSTRTHR